MTKKIIATALLSAFSISATAAEVTIGGEYAFAFQSVNNTDTGSTDAELNFVATEELANGMTVSADWNFDAEGANDGDNSLTVSGAFGTLDLGNTSSATDKIDDKMDWGYFLTTGVSNPDHSALYTLPSFVDGLSVHVSYAAPDGNPDDNAGGAGASFNYATDLFSLGYGQVEQRDGTEYATTNGTITIAGLTVGAEKLVETSSADVDTDYTVLGATYTVDSITFAVESSKEESAGTVASDLMTYGAHYAVGGGLTAFAEYQEDDTDTENTSTAVGLAYAF